MKRLLQKLSLALLLAAVCGATAQADERILRYHSDITVNADGTMDVIETIRVRAEGARIRRGIYRDFPTDYRDRFGNKVRVGFELQQVRRDGRAEPHHTERRSNGIRIYAGSRDVFLRSGEYEYAFHYRVSRMLGFFDDHDELYWNVTGNGWDFIIDRASASVTLPDSVASDDITIEGYTGAFGSAGQDYVASVDGQGRAQIRTTGPLPRRNGLTLVASWPKGHVAEPTFTQNAAFLLSQNLGLLIAMVATLGALLYLFLAWRKVGVDPPAGVIFPHYEPPEGFSPASIRYVARMGYDKRAFTAAVLNLAVKGFLTIRKSGGDYTLQRTDKPADEDMAPGEAALLSQLFRFRTSMLLDNENHSQIGAAVSAHRKTLRGYHHKRYFLTNGAFLLPAVLILFGALVLVVNLNELTVGVGIVLGIGALSVPLFLYLLKAPTPPGRKLLDKVEGFKMYLEVAEKEDLNLRNPPEKTPQLFEAYLPYALALGVEQPWADQFADVFRRLRDERGEDYAPAWYSGHGWDSSNPVRFAGEVGDSLNSAISSAATPPGSSSGGGGGGFSGGGGGGGGGGGW